MIEDGALSDFVDARYDGWNGETARQMLSGNVGLEAIAERVEAENINPSPRSGRQEFLENAVNRYV